MNLALFSTIVYCRLVKLLTCGIRSWVVPVLRPCTDTLTFAFFSRYGGCCNCCYHPHHHQTSRMNRTRPLVPFLFPVLVPVLCHYGHGPGLYHGPGLDSGCNPCPDPYRDTCPYLYHDLCCNTREQMKRTYRSVIYYH